ncbi:MAG: HTH domain-containing protein [Nanoarchaeota archaeon]
MKNQEIIYRELLFRVMERKEFSFTQSELSKKLDISLSIINSAIKRLNKLGAVKIHQRSFNIIDIKKILYLWASIRNLEKDTIFKTRLEIPVREIERLMPDIVFTAYTSYKLKFNDAPADYSEIYAYADEKQLDAIKKRISKLKLSEKNPNLFILKKDSLMDLYKSLPISQLFVDLWNLKEWYAKEFLTDFERRIFENK